MGEYSEHGKEEVKGDFYSESRKGFLLSICMLEGFCTYYTLRLKGWGNLTWFLLGVKFVPSTSLAYV